MLQVDIPFGYLSLRKQKKMNEMLLKLLDEHQLIKLYNWEKKFKPSTAAIGGEFTYCFTPTGLGIIIKVKQKKVLGGY